MRKTVNINKDWKFFKNEQDLSKLEKSKDYENVSVPHNWNSVDGQDGGGDYYRGKCWYTKVLPAIDAKKDEEVYIEFKGVNASATVYINGQSVTHHDGGYSTFRACITSYLTKKENILAVLVDNSENDAIYPQKADFTFYGGIYRDVNIITVNKNHFDLDYFGGCGVKIDAICKDKDGVIKVEPYGKFEGDVKTIVLDNGKEIKTGEKEVEIKNIHRWHGIKDPHLYEVKVQLINKGKVVDEVVKNVGFREFKVHPRKGFFLNGEYYPLRGVSRHQDFKGIGNSLTKKHHDNDFAMIMDMGANTVRLAHYQHDDYVYDLCDKLGLVVWAEIPYISRHQDVANKNSIDQMKELITQQYHHPSICVWGTSNEITMFGGHQKELVKQNKILNGLCHTMDPYRLTTLACFAMCGPFNKISKVTDVVSWNLYFGWYTPFLWLNKAAFGFYHLVHFRHPIGLSEYGAEGMTNLHAQNPKRGDSTEEYQTKYHEYMLKFFEKRPYLWATHVWNMFDFGSDGRNQGGEPGVNHKGLVTFDRKIKKDSYYAYKAYWSHDPFVQIAEKRFVNRTANKITVKVYSNQPEVELFVNDKSVGVKKGNKIFKFNVELKGKIVVKAIAGKLTDEATFNHVDELDQNYILHTESNNYSWEK